MTDTQCIDVAELQLTAETLEKLGVLADVNILTGAGVYAKDTNTRIDEYGQHFKRLYKAIHGRYKD